MYQQPNYYAYGVGRPQARNTQPLTPEQIAKLRQDSNAFDMKVYEEDMWRSACTHKELNGQSTLIANDDGTYTCTICHETFRMSDSTKADIEKAVDTLLDMLQTSKTVYLDAPEELIKQYYQIIPLLKKFPQLWERAIKNFAMYEGNSFNNMLNPVGPGYSGFAALNNLMSNPYAYMQPQPQAPYGGQMPYQPQAPQMQVPYGGQMAYGQQAPWESPAPYGGQVPYQPQAQYGQNPVAYDAPPVAPMPGAVPASAPAQTASGNNEVQQQKVFNV